MSANPAQTTIRQDMEIDNSHSPTPSASAPQIVDGQMPATGHRGIRKRAQKEAHRRLSERLLPAVDESEKELKGSTQENIVNLEPETAMNTKEAHRRLS